VISAKKQFDIQRVSPEEIQAFIRNYAPRGRFLAKEGRKWVAVDNSTGDVRMEEFRSKRQAVRWLRGKFEVREQACRFFL